MSHNFIKLASLAILSALTLSACNETGRDSITESLGSAVQYNKMCQMLKLPSPAGCVRAASTGQQADEAVIGYEESMKQSSTLRVKSAPIMSGSSGGSVGQ